MLGYNISSSFHRSTWQPSHPAATHSRVKPLQALSLTKMHGSISLLGWQHWVTCGIALSEVKTISLAVFSTVTGLSQKTSECDLPITRVRGPRAICHTILQPLLTSSVSNSQSAGSSRPWAANTRVFPSTLATCLVMDLGDFSVKLISLAVSVIGGEM